MKRNFYRFLVLVILTSPAFFCPKDVAAHATISSSAKLIRKIYVSPVMKKKTYKNDARVIKLQQFLERQCSGLSPYAEFMVKRADYYHLPWNLVTAIAGVESTFCRHIPSGSANCWGWNNGNFRFISFGYGIETVSKTLANSYFQKGRTTPESIAPVYAPPSVTWARKIRHYMNLIEYQEIPEPVVLSLNI